jgi:DNA mismatch repair protein MutS
MGIAAEYFAVLKKYSTKHGKQTIVLMQVGSFYEIYGIDNDKEKIGNAAELSSLLNIVLTRRNKSIISNSMSNPLMLGFPCVAFEKYMPIMLDAGYTVVVVDQVKNGLTVERMVSQVVSPSTYLEGDGDGHLILIYLEGPKQQLHLGISAINVITGKSIVNECHSAQADMRLALDETLLFMQQYRSRETVICWQKIHEEIVNDAVEYLAPCNPAYRFVNKCTLQVAYQETVLGSVFKNSTMLSNIELLNLEKHPLCVISYVLLIEHVYSYNPILIKRIERPAIYSQDKHLTFTANAIEQLDILKVKKISSGKGITCLYDVINNCVTPDGKRLLKERIVLPVSDADEIERRLKMIDVCRDTIGNDPRIEKCLSNIGDLNRLNRRMSMGIMKPNELGKIYDSYKSVLELYSILSPGPNEPLVLGELGEERRPEKYCKALQLINKKDADIISVFVCNCSSMFDTNKLYRCEAAFKPGVVEEYDNLVTEIETHYTKIQAVANTISDKIKGGVKIECLQSTGYFISMPTARAKYIHGNFTLQKGKAITKITSSTIDTASKAIMILKANMEVCVDKAYKRILYNMNTRYGRALTRAATAVSEIDVVRSHYLSAIKNGYCRPKIVKRGKSFISAKALRHPIIERLNRSIEYVPNDISIGDDQCKGIVLYSMNSGGKTSLIKACGLAVILAQIGSYVPAEQLEISPFKLLAIRIISESSILSGKSSFIAEMQDLRSILKRSNSNTLVLADEITHGTEHLSGSAIFASSVTTLAKRDVRFMFSTHLHSVYNFVSKIPTVKVCHLAMRVCDKDIIFEHKLCDGPGSSVYGLEVCEFMDMDREFLITAFQIRDRIECTKRQPLLSHLDIKNSRYSKDKMVTVCQVCEYSPRSETDSPLDVHHIKAQSTSDENGMIAATSKDALSNLVTLCKQCHNKAHKGGLAIKGYIKTLQGTKLQYNIP